MVSQKPDRIASNDLIQPTPPKGTIKQGHLPAMASNPRVMGTLPLNRRQKFFGWRATMGMPAAAIGLLATWGK